MAYRYYIIIVSCKQLYDCKKTGAALNNSLQLVVPIQFLTLDLISLYNGFLWHINDGHSNSLCAGSSSLSPQHLHVALIVALLNLWQFVWSRYVPVNILYLIISFFTLKTHNSKESHSECVWPIFIDSLSMNLSVDFSLASCFKMPVQ